MPVTSGTPAPSREPEKRRSLNDRLYQLGESVSTSFVTPRGPGWIMRCFFKFPILFYRIGFARILGKYVLLLTTTGRKTGKPRVTALEYTHDGADDCYFVTSGWGERSQWLRNLRANPKVHVRVINREFDCVAESTPDDRAIQLIAGYNRRHPNAERMWERCTGVPFDGLEAGLREIARRCPTLTLRPFAR